MSHPAVINGRSCNLKCVNENKEVTFKTIIISHTLPGCPFPFN